MDSNSGALDRMPKKSSTFPYNNTEDETATSRAGRIREVAGQTTGVASGRLLAAGAQAITIVLLARWCEPTLFGLTMATQTVLTTLVVASQFGLPQYMAVMRAQAPESAQVYSTLRLNSKGSIYFVCAAVAGVFTLSQIHNDFWLFLPLAFATAWQRNGAIWDSIAVADSRIGLFSTNIIMRRILALCLFCVLFWANTHPVLAYCLAICGSEIAYNYRIKRGVKFELKASKRIKTRVLLKNSQHYWRDSISGQIRLLDVTVVTLLLGPSAGGLVAVPSKIGSPIMLIPSSFATLFLPKVSRGGPPAAREALYLALAITGTIAVLLGCLSLFVEELITLFLGSSYLPAVVVTKVYFVIFTFTALIHMLGSILQGLGFQRAIGRNSLAFSSVSLIFIACGALTQGLETAAWGYAIGAACQVFGILSIFVFYVINGRKRLPL